MSQSKAGRKPKDPRGIKKGHVTVSDALRKKPAPWRIEGQILDAIKAEAKARGVNQGAYVNDVLRGIFINGQA